MRSADAVVLRRCPILLASARGVRAPRIAEQLGCDDQTVPNALRAFNAIGLTCQGALSSIQPTWVHSKRATFEFARLPGAQEIADRACAYVDCSHGPYLTISHKVAGICTSKHT